MFIESQTWVKGNIDVFSLMLLSFLFYDLYYNHLSNTLFQSYSWRCKKQFYIY